MLRYWKNRLLLKKMSLLLKKKCLTMEKFFALEKNPFAIEQNLFAIETPLTSKNLCFIGNIVIKLGAYLHSEVHFCPHSQCQLLWECCLWRFRFSNHFSNTYGSFQANLMKEINIFKCILEVNKFMKSALTKKKKSTFE